MVFPPILLEVISMSIMNNFHAENITDSKVAKSNKLFPHFYIYIYIYASNTQITYLRRAMNFIFV